MEVSDVSSSQAEGTVRVENGSANTDINVLLHLRSNGDSLVMTHVR